MKSRTILSFCALLVIWNVLFSAAESYADKRELDEITQAIQKNKSRWSVKDNAFANLTADERKKRLGAQLPALSADVKTLDVPSASLPLRLDWRSYNGGNYVTPVKDQGACGACWAFATTAALESKVLIAQNTPGSPLDLSEQLLTSCSGSGTCSMGSIGTASDFLSNFGLPPESFYPYTATDGPCLIGGSDWQESSYKITGWSLVNPTVTSIKSALYNYGPLVTLMIVQTDFYYYGSGIYAHSWGSFEGYHAALIIGYDDTEQYFIVKSSWGADWGEVGYFRIAYSEMASATLFGAWTIAYNNALSSDFPIIDGIARSTNSPETNSQGKDESGNAKNGPKSPGQSGDSASGNGSQPDDKNNDNAKSEPEGTSALTGTVKDEAGNVISGAEIKTGKLTAITDENGTYLLTGLAAGDHVVTAGEKGYISVAANINLPPDTTIAKDFLLTRDKTGSDHGQPKDPGQQVISAAHISRDEAKRYYASKLLEQSSVVPLAAVAEPAKELLELARALHNDPTQILEYVRNNIDYVPYYGSLKGALLTYLDGSGNDCDQASLLIALLRASGYEAQYAFRDFQTSGYELSYWVGIDDYFTKSTLLPKILDGGGIPYDILANGAFYTLDRIFVKARIGSTDVLYDPTWKTYIYTSPKLKSNCSEQSNICTAMGYVATNLNESNIATQLQQYSTALANTFRTDNYANNDLREIIGGRSIDKVTHSTAFTIIDPQWPPADIANKPACWPNCTDMPEMFVTKLVIQYGNKVYTLLTPDLDGRRLIFTPTATAHELRLDDDAPLTPATVGTAIEANTLAISVDHPYAATCDKNRNGILVAGCYADTSHTYKVINGGTYAIVYNFGGISATRLRIRQAKLDTYVTTQDASKALGEALNIMGVTWTQELQMANELLSRLADTSQLSHHQVGLMAQETKIVNNTSVPYHFIDAGNAFMTVASYYLADCNFHKYAYNLIGSSLEHSILEQMQMLYASRIPAVSTTKLFKVARDNNKQIYLVDKSNFLAVKPYLLNYGSELSVIENKINIAPAVGAYTFVLPSDGNLTLNNWNGKGYISIYNSATQTGLQDISMIIGDGYHGGFITNPLEVDKPWVNRVIETDLKYNFEDSLNARWRGLLISTSLEPVDMASGAYLYDHADLELSGAAPLGLNFSRFYDSRLSKKKGSLGYGWTHSYESSLSITSDPWPALGRRQPVDAASLIAALRVMLDLLTTPDSQQSWVKSSFISNWAVDQIVDNAVTIIVGNKSMEFIKLADGSYASPPGVTIKLVKNTDGTYSLQERFGTVTNFNGDKKLSSITDIDGNAMTFTYSGGKLTTVKDAFNRTLGIYYSGDRISSVTDSASPSRTVSYGYDGNSNLTTYTDPESKVWSYGYDTNNNHWMTSLKNPLNVTTATNAYDTLGRVKTQIVPRQVGTATYSFYFSGYRNQEVDPGGNAITYWYDEKGREYKITDQLGKSTVRQYDGQNHITKLTDPRSYSASYVYDGNHDLQKIIYPATQPTKEVNYAYDSLYRLTDTYQGVQGASLTPHTHFAYNAQHHLMETYRYPDASTVLNTSATYYDTGSSKGLQKTATDGRRTATEFVYDSYGNPRTAKTASHPVVTSIYDSIGRLTSLTDQESSVTSFTYDKRNLLQTRTDPLNRMTGNYYDSAGRLTNAGDRNYNELVYGYTPTDKLASKGYYEWYYDGEDEYPVYYPLTTFTYNQLDNLTSMQDSLGATSYTEYDAANRLKSMTDPHGFTVKRDYDEAGNVKKITYPGNKTVSYTYDELNRLKTVKIDWLSSSAATYTYDAAGRVDYFTPFNGTMVDYGYDNANRLTSLENKNGSAVLAGYSFILDGNGNRTTVTRTEPLTVALDTNSVTYYYNSKKNRLESTTAAGSFTYDNEGQLAMGYGVGYPFDKEHRLTAIGSAYQFAYDGLGKRLRATRNGVITRYIYDASGNLLAEADGSNNITKYYIYGQGLLAMATSSGQLYCYHFDATGNTIAMTDGSKNIVNKYAYDAFGNITQQVEAVSQPFKYVGQYGVMAEPNGFYYMRARYYDPKVGRFISEDPIGFDGGDVNLYAYVQNNPVMGIDPNGLEIRIYNRPAMGPIGWLGGNHAFLYSTETGRYSGMGGADEIRLGTIKTGSYSVVPNPNGVSEIDVINYMDKTKDSGIWFPIVNDCHTKVDNTLKNFGLENLGAPGGRWGTIPNSPAPSSDAVSGIISGTYGGTGK